MVLGQERAWLVLALGGVLPLWLIGHGSLSLAPDAASRRDPGQTGLLYLRPGHTVGWSTPVHGPVQISGEGTPCLLLGRSCKVTAAAAWVQGGEPLQPVLRTGTR